MASVTAHSRKSSSSSSSSSKQTCHNDSQHSPKTKQKKLSSFFHSHHRHYHVHRSSPSSPTRTLSSSLFFFYTSLFAIIVIIQLRHGMTIKKYNRKENQQQQQRKGSEEDEIRTKWTEKKEDFWAYEAAIAAVKPVSLSDRKEESHGSMNETTAVAGSMMYNTSQIENNAKTLVIILTQARTGSSFVGGMFDVHPDIFYLFEPLMDKIKPGNQTWNKKVLASGNTRIIDLDDIMNCHFQVHTHPIKNDLQCIRSTHCRSHLLLHRPLQNAILPLSITREECSKRTKRVAKFIRLFRLHYIREQLLPKKKKDDDDDDDNVPTNIRIINLIRDPRSVIYSRMHSLQDYRPKDEHDISGIRSAAKEICERMDTQSNLNEIAKMIRDYGGNKTEDGGEGGSFSFMRVRYEDIVQDPLDWARYLHQFAFGNDNDYFSLLEDRALDERLAEYVNKTSPKKSSASAGIETTTTTTKAASGGRRNHFSLLSKNSLQDWRIGMNREAIEIIEDVCAEAMMSAGYDFPTHKQ